MFEITKWRLYCCYLFSNNVARNAKESNDAARAVRNLHNALHNVCANVCFFPWKVGTVIRHGGQGKRIASKQTSLITIIRRKIPRKLTRTAYRKEKEIGCTAMHEIPLYEKRGHASLRNEIISPLSALNRDGSFTSIPRIFAEIIIKRILVYQHPRYTMIYVHLISTQNICN